nr:hypothetical protein [Butyrivibrio sp. M55]
MRISEFCGLTLSDIDFKNHCINVDHQLQKGAHVGYYIEETKTEIGRRKIPMTLEVEALYIRFIGIITSNTFVINTTASTKFKFRLCLRIYAGIRFAVRWQSPE